jgi:hypothetical protein
MACCALSLLVAARRMSPGLVAGIPLLKLRVLVLALHTLPDASDMASDVSCEADSLRSAALTMSAALGTDEAPGRAAAACGPREQTQCAVATACISIGHSNSDARKQLPCYCVIHTKTCVHVGV